jgi:hypothetical protein
VDATRLAADGKRKVAKHFIKAAIKHPGALHKDLGVPEGEKIPEDKLRAATHSKDPLVRKRANFAMTLKGLHHGGEKKTRSAKEVRGKMYGSKE